MRKLASVQRILDIQPIEGADKIVKAQINGWQVVTAIDNGFKVGDLVVYCEIDAFLPHDLAPFLSKGKEPREYNGVKGERLRTIKLRGTLSQGMILPLDKSLWESVGGQIFGGIVDDISVEGTDLTELLGIQKWEPPMNAQLQGVCRSTFPSHIIPKTDQERCQNIKADIVRAYDNGDKFEISRKYDGSSMTVYTNLEYDFGVPAPTLVSTNIGVCSRNMDLELDQEGNSFVDTAKSCGIVDALQKYCKDHYTSLAVQGELCGPGIQGNPEKLDEHHFYVFDIYDIDAKKYLTPQERLSTWVELKKMCGDTFDHVLIIDIDAELPSDEISELLKFAEGKNNAGVEREGVVFKRMDGKFSFKAISNKFLLQSDQ